MALSKVEIDSFFSSKRAHSVDYVMYYFMFCNTYEDNTVGTNKLTIENYNEPKNKWKFSIDTIGQVQPYENDNDVCIAGVKRSYEKDTSYIVVVFPKKNENVLDDITLNKYYAIVKRMGLVSPYVTKDMFRNNINIINTNIHSSLYLYVTTSIIRSIREDVLFIKKFVYLVDNYVDPYVAYVVASVYATNYGHHIIPPYNEFAIIRLEEAQFNTSYIARLYSLLKKGQHKEYPPINEYGFISFSVHSDLKATEEKYPRIKSIDLLTYANSIARSIKISTCKKSNRSFLKMLDRIGVNYNEQDKQNFVNH